MRPFLRWFLALAVALLVAGPARAAPPEGIRPGLSPEEVRDQLGAPARVARQVLHLRILEQWTYDAPTPLRLTFEHARGQPPRLVQIRELPRP